MDDEEVTPDVDVDATVADAIRALATQHLSEAQARVWLAYVQGIPHPFHDHKWVLLPYPDRDALYRALRLRDEEGQRLLDSAWMIMRDVFEQIRAKHAQDRPEPKRQSSGLYYGITVQYGHDADTKYDTVQKKVVEQKNISVKDLTNKVKREDN